MSFQFSSNLSFMFTECPTIIGRYKLAKDSGFRAVESGFPLGFNVQDVADAKNTANVDQILINVYTGDVTKGELGFAAIPGKEKEFQKSIDLTVEYARALDCKKIHVMSGKVESPSSLNDTSYEMNLRYAVEIFKSQGIVGLIEPINIITVPNYYMNNFEKALELVKKIDSPHLKLMVDLFHLQHSRGNITHTIKDYFPYIGHIQVAQVPDRHEPDTSGEIDYSYVFSLLEKVGYDGFIGLEYKPKTTTVEGLKWLKKFGFTL